MQRIMEFLKTTVVGGIIFLVPIVAIFFVIGKALKVSSQIAQPFAALLPFGTVANIAIVDIIGAVALVLICFLAGFAARTTLASTLVREAEARFLLRVPGYTLLKGLVDGIGSESPESSMRPVLMQLDDAAQLAFEVERLPDGRVVLFVPGAPNPWSGSVLVVDAERVQALPITMMAAVQNMRTAGRGTRDFLGVSASEHQSTPGSRSPVEAP